MGSYVEVVQKALDYEKERPWSEKANKLFWKGVINSRIGGDVRRPLASVANKEDWGQIQELKWKDVAISDHVVKMEEHCGFKYLAQADGNTYSGRLK